MKRTATILLLVIGIYMPFYAQTTFTALSGTISNFGETDIIIKPTGASKIELTITSLAIYEEGFDFYIYNGETYYGSILATYSSSSTYSLPITITSSGNSVYLKLDYNNEEPTFTITYKAITNNWLPNGNNVLYNNGYVGIGTLAPNFPFTVEKQRGNTNAKFGASSSVYIVNTAPAIGFNTYLENGWKFGKTTNATTGNAGLLSYNTTEGKMYYLASSAAGAENATATMNYVMSLTNDSKLGLGIGNTSPTSSLDIKQPTNTATGGIHLISGASNWYMFNNANGYLQLSKTGAASTGFTFNYDATNGMYFSIGDYLTAGRTSLLFKTSANTNGYSIIQSIKSKTTLVGGDLLLNPEGGKVGIGTASADAPLTVYGTSNFYPNMVGAVDARVLSIKNTLSNPAFVDNNFPVVLATGGGNQPLILDAARVGIGIATPTQKLTIESSGDKINSIAGFYNPVAIANAQGKGAAINLGWNANNYYAKIAAVFENNTPSYLNPALVFYTMNETNAPESEEERMRISSNGNVLIKEKLVISKTRTNSNYQLDVDGTIRANEVKINADGQDIVFAPNYILRPLTEVESFIKQNQHLPEIAPAKDMQNNGVNISELQMQLLQKVEELTLYMIEQDKKSQEQTKQIEALKLENEKLKKKMGL
jgi:hypothetical protein